MQFNENDLGRMLQACEYYKSFTSNNEGVRREFDYLIHKIHNYESEYECPDCNYVKCEIHAVARS